MKTEPAAPSKLAIQAIDLSKCYRIYNHPRDRLLQVLWGRDRRGRRSQFYREFWALQHINFELGPGQTLGIVGRNGSGKSTLLQLLCGTLQPTSGTAHINGRVGALLELGSGFNPEFSGLENVFLNASVLGLSRAETEARLDQILCFADIGDFIHQPVKTYSSGMAIRLAFAVQAHIDPDVLIVDEALAVGDELFQKKCYSHLERLKERGTSILLVTHNVSQIMQHCDQALLLHKGQARILGEPARVVVMYQRLLNSNDSEWDKIAVSEGKLDHNSLGSQQVVAKNQPPSKNEKVLEDIMLTSWFDTFLVPQSTQVYESNGGSIEDAWTEAANGEKANVIPFGEDFSIIIKYRAMAQLNNVAMSCFISNHTGQGISGQTVPANIGPQPNGSIKSVSSGTEWSVRYSFRGSMWPGVYLISCALVTFQPGGKRFIHRVIDYCAIRIIENSGITPLGACSLTSKQPHIEGLYVAEGAAAGWNMNIE